MVTKKDINTAIIQANEFKLEIKKATELKELALKQEKASLSSLNEFKVQKDANDIIENQLCDKIKESIILSISEVILSSSDDQIYIKELFKLLRPKLEALNLVCGQYSNKLPYSRLSLSTECYKLNKFDKPTYIIYVIAPDKVYKN